MPKSVLNVTIGNRIKRARVSANLTQEALARETKIKQSTISQLEAGLRPASIAQIAKISRASNVSLNFFLP